MQGHETFKIYVVKLGIEARISFFWNINKKLIPVLRVSDRFSFSSVHVKKYSTLVKEWATNLRETDILSN